MLTRILTPLDGSPQAESVIPGSSVFARAFGSTLFLMRVVEPARNDPRGGRARADGS